MFQSKSKEEQSKENKRDGVFPKGTCQFFFLD